MKLHELMDTLVPRPSQTPENLISGFAGPAALVIGVHPRKQLVERAQAQIVPEGRGYPHRVRRTGIREATKCVVGL